MFCGCCDYFGSCGKSGGEEPVNPLDECSKVQHVSSVEIASALQDGKSSQDTLPSMSKQMSKRAVTGKMAGSLSARRGGGVVDDGDDKEEEEEEKKEIETMETTSAYYNPK